MRKPNIAIIGDTKSVEKFKLLSKYFNYSNFDFFKKDNFLSSQIAIDSYDVFIIACGARSTASCCLLIKHAKVLIHSKRLIVVSEIKDADLMFEVLNQGMSKFILDTGDTNKLCLSVEKEIKSILAQRQLKKILAIGAHPDDVEIGCGGTIKKHTERGDDVLVLTLTKGAKGGNKAEREIESKNAAKSMGAKLIMHDLEDTNLSSCKSIIKCIETSIKEFQPDLVYTHSINDTHQDHRATHYASLVAARSIQQIYAYLAPSGTIDFHPRYFEHIENYIEDKMDAINCFTSQTVVSNRPYLKSSIIKSTAEYWGRFSNYGRVEPFEVIRA